MKKFQVAGWEVCFSRPDCKEENLHWVLESAGIQGGTRFLLLAELLKDTSDIVMVSGILRGALAALSGFLSHPSDFLAKLSGEVSEIFPRGSEPRLVIFGLPLNKTRPAFAISGFPESSIVMPEEGGLEFTAPVGARFTVFPVSESA